ncbi:MAG: hypothetical protein ACYC9S_09715 [Leptospirales bacterium]
MGQMSQKAGFEMVVVFRIVLFLASLSLIGLGACLAYKNETKSAGLALGSGIFLLFFVFLPEFAKFKGLGFEAILKEKIQEADKTLERLREFAPSIASMVMSIMNRQGRWVGPVPRKDQYEFIENVKKNLMEMGISKDHVEKILENTHNQIEFDMAFDLLNEPVHALDKKMNAMPETSEKNEFVKNRNQFLNELQKTREEWVIDRDTRKYEQKMIDLVQGCGLLDGREKEEINIQIQEDTKDLEEYQHKRTFRRGDVWFSKGPS